MLLNYSWRELNYIQRLLGFRFQIHMYILSNQDDNDVFTCVCMCVCVCVLD